MNTLTIARKELTSYFRSPIAYGVIAFFALIAGYFFYASVIFFVRRGTEMAMMGQSQPMDVNEYVIRPLFSNISVIALFLIPMISMRLFAEEKRTGTIELLVTSPLSDMSIILGKWLAAVALFVGMLVVSALSMSMLFFYGSPDWRPILVGYLGLFLMGASLLAIGTYISTLSKNQIVAGVATFAICLMLWILNWVTEFGTSIPERVAGYIAITSHLDSFGKGVLDLKDVVYYLSVIFVGLFLTARSLESLRWRA
jgi:ABC-2 type transport system permease protein